MRNRCLPCHLIARNVCVLLASVAGVLLVFSEIHSSANDQSQQAEALQRLFVFQVVTQMEKP